MTREQIFLENPITGRYNKSKLIPFRIPGLKEYNSINPGYVDHIITTICKHTGIQFPELLTKSRQRELVYTRHLCFYFLSMHTKLSLKTIGQMLGGKDHTTVIHGRETLRDLIFSDDKVREDVNLIKTLI